jgi:DNA-binding MarR family transcriptional regulator
MPTKSKTADSTANLIASECLAVRVRLLNRTITGIYDEALRPHGLTTGQLNLLVVVAKRGPISPGAVAQLLNMKKSTVSRNVELMRKKGWVNVTPVESGRALEIKLSRKGRTLLERSLPAWEEAQTRAMALLGQSGAKSIHRVGNTIWSSFGRD